jgi:hypothetical protein
MTTRKRNKRVTFCQGPSQGSIREDFIESSFKLEEDAKPLWWSRDEIRQILRQNVQVLDELKDEDPSYMQGVTKLFQECSKGSTSANCNILLNAPRDDIRGLERQMHKMISQHRASHVRSIVKIQRHVRRKEIGERLLRRLSAKSSRASRVMAQVMAHYDSMQLASMIRQELLDSESNERWPTKFTGPQPVESGNRRQLVL